MKISDVIKDLEAYKEKYGDVPVIIIEEGFGGHAYHEVAGLGIETINMYDLEEENGYNFSENPDDIEMLKTSFNDFEDMDFDNPIQVCITIHNGQLIYST